MSELEYDDSRVASGPISYEDLEEICKVFPYAKFQQYINNASYLELSQVREELVIREGKIKIQLGNRHVGELWKKKAESALAIICNKLRTVQSRIEHIKHNNLSNIVKQYGSIESMGGNRLACIRALLDIVDRNSKVKFTTEEISVLDLCRRLGQIPEDSSFSSLNFNTVRSSIHFEDGTEVASINKNVFMSEEYGYRFAAADEMRKLLDRSERMTSYLAANSKCRNNGEHVVSKCAHCLAETLRQDIASLISRLR